MRLDKIKFARLISFIQSCTNRPFEGNEIAHIDDMIDIEAPIRYDGFVSMEKVDELLMCMVTIDAGLTPAIKAYRALTNASLLEAKAAVERGIGSRK